MIRALQESDIKGLNRISPIDWNFDYERFVNNYKKHDFYYAFVMIKKGKIIGTGNVFLKGKIGWLANVIIDSSFRRKGLGLEMTEFLVEFLKGKRCETQLLIATELGEPVYKKLGFKKISAYVCFDIEIENNFVMPSAIRSLVATDLEEVYQLDFEANDENRKHLIDKYYKTGFGYFKDNNRLVGVYLPDFGRGLVLAKDKSVGLEFLKIKHAKTAQRTLIPIENKAGIKYLESIGKKVGVTASRMILGKENRWNPNYIYSYGGGYCG